MSRRNGVSVTPAGTCVWSIADQLRGVQSPSQTCCRPTRSPRAQPRRGGPSFDTPQTTLWGLPGLHSEDLGRPAWPPTLAPCRPTRSRRRCAAWRCGPRSNSTPPRSSCCSGAAGCRRRSPTTRSTGRSAGSWWRRTWLVAGSAAGCRLPASVEALAPAGTTRTTLFTGSGSHRNLRMYAAAGYVVDEQARYAPTHVPGTAALTEPR